MHSISIPPINDVIYIMHRCRSFGSVSQFRSNQGQNSQGNIDHIYAWNLHPTAGKFIYLYAQRLQSWGNNKGTLTKCERGFTKGDLTKLKKKKRSTHCGQVMHSCLGFSLSSKDWMEGWVPYLLDRIERRQMTAGQKQRVARFLNIPPWNWHLAANLIVMKVWNCCIAAWTQNIAELNSSGDFIQIMRLLWGVVLNSTLARNVWMSLKGFETLKSIKAYLEHVWWDHLSALHCGNYCHLGGSSLLTVATIWKHQIRAT